MQQNIRTSPRPTKGIPQSWILNTVFVLAVVAAFAAYNHKRDTTRPPDRVEVGRFGGHPTGVVFLDKKNGQSFDEFAYSIPTRFRTPKEVADWMRVVFNFKGKLSVEKDSTGQNFIVSYATRTP